jgi:hypothetical protein
MNGIEEQRMTLTIAEAHILLMSTDRLVTESREDEEQWEGEKGYEGPMQIDNPRTGGESTHLGVALALRERIAILVGSIYATGDGTISMTHGEAIWLQDSLYILEGYLEEELDEGEEGEIRGLRSPIRSLASRFRAEWSIGLPEWDSETEEL